MRNPQLLRDNLLLARDFASVTANGFIGGLVFKFACPTIANQQLMSHRSPFSIFFGQQ